MTLRHAAALALVGWYLMVPFAGKGPYFGGWTIRATFENQGECEAAAAKLRADGYGSSAVDQYDPRDPNGTDKASQTWQKVNATCNPFTDPRLKSK
jgi:hypothetical protein